VRLKSFFRMAALAKAKEMTELMTKQGDFEFVRETCKCRQI
jgi:hypothetical protein